MFTFFLVLHALIAAALVTVILMQRSEGGGLGMGGSPSGLMSARGAADFLTRATTILATLFVVMSIGLAALATVQGGPRKIDASLARPQPAPGTPLVPAAPAAAPGAVPFDGDPLAGAASALPGATATPDAATPATTPAARPAGGERTRAATPAAEPKAAPAPAAQPKAEQVTPPGVAAPTAGNSSTPQ